MSITLAATTSTVQAYNVVGLVKRIRFRRRNEWAVVESASRWGGRRAITPTGDSIYNAADDNGTGSAGNLAIASALMHGPRPMRSILLVWDSGEETGLWGSRFLAYGPLADKVVAHFTVDMIGRTKVPGTSVRGREPVGTVTAKCSCRTHKVLSTELDSVLARRVSHATTASIHFDRRFEDPTHEFFYPRTDAAPYIERGIPYIEFFTGLHGDYTGRPTKSPNSTRSSSRR